MTTASPKIEAPQSWKNLSNLELHAAHNETSREMQRLAAVPTSERVTPWLDEVVWMLERYDFSHAEHARRGITISKSAHSANPEVLAKRAALGMLPGETLADTLRRAVS